MLALTHISLKTMINLDERYQSYLKGTKKFRIDGIEEKVKGYGYRDDGKELIGYYVTTENYQLDYNFAGQFVGKQSLGQLNSVKC